jgi:hypothetical protein
MESLLLFDSRRFRVLRAVRNPFLTAPEYSSVIPALAPNQEEYGGAEFQLVGLC